jgi:PAS domain S-box-containing protein
MNVLLIGVAAGWEERLREQLLQRGNIPTIIHDVGEIPAALEQANYHLAFVGVDKTIDKALDVCRQLRASSAAQPLQILTCGVIHSPEEMQALLSAGVNDCLTDLDNAAQLGLRLALAEYCAASAADSFDNAQATIRQNDFIIPFDDAVDGVMRSTYEGKIVAANEGLVKMLGYGSREELMQIDLNRDLYVDYSARRKIIDDPSSEFRTIELTWKRRDGKPIEVRTFGRRVHDQAGKLLYFEIVVWDITESKIAANLLKNQCDLAVKLSKTCDLHTTLEAVLQAAMQIEGIDSAGVYLLNESTQVFELAAFIGVSPRFVEAVARYSLDTSRAKSLMQGSPLYLASEEIQHPSRTALQKEGIKIIAIIPIVNQSKVIGMLHLGSRVQKQISLTTRQAVESIAKQIGGSIAQAQVETALHQSQQNLQALFDSLQDMVFVLDESGRLLHTNPMVGKRLGYSSAELAKMEIRDLHPPERGLELLHLCSQIMTGQTRLWEIPLLSKDGAEIPVEILVTRGKWAGSDAIFGVSRDLTESHRARRALFESESRFRAIFESAAIGLALSDLEGKILEVNGTLAEMLGCTPAELIGKSYTFFSHPNDIEPIRPLLIELMEGKRNKVLFEERFIHKNRSSIWCRLSASLLRDAEGAPRYIIVIVENITQRKAAEDRLRENEALLRRLFDNLPDFVILVDRNAKILFANHDAPGMSKEALLGRDGFSFIFDSHKPQCHETFSQALSTLTVQKGEALDVFGHFWSCLVVPLAGQGEAEQAMLILTDITAQRKAAEAIQNEQQLLRRIIDLHERDRQVIAAEIHDGIAQQVTSSLYHLQAFRRLREADAKQADHSLETAIELLSKGADEIRRLISGLHPLILDEYGILEAIEYLICEKMDPGRLQITFQHDVQFERLIPFLESAIFRIIEEALDNACCHSRSAVVAVELVQRDTRLHIKIADQGVGFDMDAVDEKHFGLRSIRERARLLGGRVEIQSAPGKGTCISVELPMLLKAEETKQ